MATRVDPSPMVGRSEELAVLMYLLDAAGRGRGAAAMVLGDPGIGKTKLAETLAAEAEALQVRVAWGRCPDIEAPPYWPWKQILGTLLDAESPLSWGGAGQRVDLFASVAEALERSLRRSPALIIVEDAHWADPSTLELAQFLASLLPGMSALMVLTSRSERSEPGREAARALAALPPAVVRLPLSGLGKESTGQLVAQVIGRPAPEGLVDEIHDRTAGNPFFVTEVARLHRSGGEAASMAVPLGVFQVVSKRLARLAPEIGELLAAAAAAGEIDVGLLVHTTGWPEEWVLEGLGEAVRAGLLVQGESGLSFEHALVRDTVYQRIQPDEVANLHRRIASGLEATGGTPAALATHWSKALGAGAREKAACYARDAGRASTRSMAYEQAACYYRWALDWGCPERLDVMVELGESQVLAGDLVLGRATLEQAAAGALAQGRAELLARAVLAMGGGVAGFEVDVSDDRLPGLIRRALELLPAGDSFLRAALLARLSLALARFGDDDERLRLVEQAVDMSRRVGDPTVIAAALSARCDVLAGPDHAATRFRSAGEMLDLANAAGNPELALVARRFKLIALLEQGRLAEVDAEIAACAQVAERLRLPLYSWQIPIWKGMRAAMEGEVDRAWTWSERAGELAIQAGSANAHMMVCALRLHIARLKDSNELVVKSLLDAGGAIGESWSDVVSAMESMIEHSALYGGPGTPCFVVYYFARLGETERARRHLAQLMSRGINTIPKDSEFLEFGWFLGEGAMLLGNREAARATADLLAPYAEVWVVDGHAGACFCIVAHLLWRLERFLGQAEEAARWQSIAAARYTEAGAGYLLEQLGTAPAAPVGSTQDPGRGRMERRGATWHLEYAGREATVLHSKGMADLAALLAGPDKEWHVLDLVEAAGGPPARAAGIGSGPVLDASARAAYKARLLAMEEDLAEAEANHDAGRAGRLVEERDLILAELGSAMGLGGRVRTSGDPVERARKAVTMRISTALKAVGSVHPELGRHLRSSVVTGRFCSYRPERPTVWSIG